MKNYEIRRTPQSDSRLSESVQRKMQDIAAAVRSLAESLPASVASGQADLWLQEFLDITFDQTDWVSIDSWSDEHIAWFEALYQQLAASPLAKQQNPIFSSSVFGGVSLLSSLRAFRQNTGIEHALAFRQAKRNATES